MITVEHTDCSGETCGSYGPGHRMHHIHARLTGESPWGWRDAQVVTADDHVLHLAYLMEPGRPRVWHHAPLAPQCPPGTPVRLHERFSVLGTPAGWIHVAVEDGIGAVPVPGDPELWAAERTHGAVNLASGTGVPLDHPDSEEPTMSAPQSRVWRSGWLGIDAYGTKTHGFADVSTNPGGAAKAEIHWLSDNAEVYTPFRLRHVVDHGTVELLAKFGDDREPDEDGDEDDENAVGSEWSVDGSEPVPVALAPFVAAGASPEQAFTAMASLHAEMFVMLGDGSDVPWDHQWMPGPNTDQLWRPVDLGVERDAFAVRAVSPPRSTTPIGHRLYRATGPDGTGYLADLGSLHLFVTTETCAWTPLFGPEQLAGYRQGEAVDVDDVEQPARDVLLAKIRFLTGPSPIS